MHTKDAIAFALTVSNGAVLSVIDEMSGAPTTFPTPNGGCHPLWVLGHLALIEGSIPAILRLPNSKPRSLSFRADRPTRVTYSSTPWSGTQPMKRF